MELFQLMGTIAVDNSAANSKINQTTGLAEKASDKMGSSFSNVAPKLNAVGTAFQNVGAKLTTVGTALTNKLTKPALIAGGALAGITLAKGWARMTEIDNAKVKLEAIGLTAEDTAGIMENATEAVKGTAFGLNEAATAAASAVAAGIEPGKDLSRYLGNIADSAAVAGTSMSDMSLIFGKVTTTGRATNESLQQLAERGLPVYQWLGEECNKTGEEIFDMASNGQISMEMLQSAVEKNIGGAAQTIGSKTITGAIANLGASISRIGANFLGSADDANSFAGKVLPLLNDLTGWLGTVEEKAKEWGAVFGEVFGAVIGYFRGTADAMNNLSPAAQSIFSVLRPFLAILKTIGQAFGALSPEMKAFVAAVVVGIGPVLKIMGTLSTGIGNVITKFTEMGGASGIAGKAIGAITSPIGLVIAGITALAGVFIYLWKTNEDFRNSIKETWASIVEFCKPLIDSIGESLKELWNGVIKPLAAFIASVLAPVFKVAFAIIGAAIKAFVAVVATVLNIVTPILQGLVTVVTAVFNAIKTVITAVINVVKAVVKAGFLVIKTVIINPIKAAWTVVKTVFNGIKTAITTVVNAVKTVVKAAFNLVKTYIINPIKAALNTVKTVFKDIKNAMVNPLKAGKKLVKAAVTAIKTAIINVFVKIPARMLSIGVDIVKGLWNGIKSVTSWVIEKVKGFGKSILDGLKSFFGIKSPSKVMEEQVGKQLALGVAEGIKKNAKYAKKSAKELAAAILEAAEKRLDKYKTYNDMTLAAEVSFWDNIRKQCKKGTDARLQADKYYFEAKQQLQEAMIAAEDEYAAKVEEVNQKIADRTDSILSSLSLFEEFTADEGLSGEQLITNLESQVNGLDEWNSQLTVLAGKIGSTNLYKALAEMGVDSLNQIKAINAMTDEQLAKYSELYDQRSNLANERAVEQLKSETDQILDDALVSLQETLAELGLEVEDTNVEIVKSIEKTSTDTLNTLTSVATETATAIDASMTEALNSVTSGLAKMKTAFESWQPKLKMPHITVSGSLDVEKGTVPTFAVSWFKSGGILTSPTIFGMQGSTLLAGGEAGAEAVAPLDTLKGYLTDAVSQGDMVGLLESILLTLKAIQKKDNSVYLNSKDISRAVNKDLGVIL